MATSHMIMLKSLYSEWRTNTIHFMNTNLVEQPSSYLQKPRSLKCPGGILVAKVDKKDKVGSYELPVLYQKDEH